VRHSHTTTAVIPTTAPATPTTTASARSPTKIAVTPSAARKGRYVGAGIPRVSWGSASSP